MINNGSLIDCPETNNAAEYNQHCHEKTNNVVFEQVRHKLSCTSTEDG